MVQDVARRRVYGKPLTGDPAIQGELFPGTVGRAGCARPTPAGSPIRHCLLKKRRNTTLALHATSTK